jgi:hypothetical protein
MLVESPHNKTALDILENVLAASPLIGVARAWSWSARATPDCSPRSLRSMDATAQRINRKVIPLQHRAIRELIELADFSFH